MPPDHPVSRETNHRLSAYENEVRRWNSRINLVSDRSLAQFQQRHVADSLQLVPLLPDRGSIADLGTGAGLPGLVVAIATGRPVILIESDGRKAAFLRSVTTTLGVSAAVIACRIEACTLTDIDVVLARALAPLPKLFGLIAPLIASNGRSLLLKGASCDAELTEAEAGWQMAVWRHPSRTAPGSCVLEVTHLRRRTNLTASVDHRDREPEGRRR